MINKLDLVGRVTRDVEINTLPSGQIVISFDVVTSDSYKDKEGNWVDNPSYTRCVTFVKEDKISHLFKKGSIVYVTGKPQANAYTDANGVAKASLELRIKDFKIISFNKENSQPISNNSNAPIPEYKSKADAFPEYNDINDDLPF